MNGLIVAAGEPLPPRPDDAGITIEQVTAGAKPVEAEAIKAGEVKETSTPPLPTDVVIDIAASVEQTGSTPAGEPAPAAATATGTVPGAEPINEPPPANGKRGRGRPPGSPNKPRFDDIRTEIPPEVNYRALAELTFDLSTNSLAAFIGDEWKPRSPDEREFVVAPLATYYKAQQVKDIPPGVLLCFCITAYSAARFTHPNTQTKAKVALGKIKLGWMWLKMKFARKRSAAPPPITPLTP